MKQLGASLMVADFLKLGAQIEALEQENIDFYHIDIMDGRFVNNFALSIDFIRLIRPLTRRTIDVHLMVERPECYIDAIAAAGADIITVHAEAVVHLQGVLSQIKRHEIKAGVALNPSTTVQSLEYVASLIDVLLIMTVNPGFAGQTFIREMYQNIAFSRKWLDARHDRAQIQVDGNIGPHTIPGCLRAGADMLVLGTSALFKADGNIAHHLNETRQLVAQTLIHEAS